MEPISAIVTSLVLGAGAIVGDELVRDAVKDAYDAVKRLILSRYPEVSVDALEQSPRSKARKAVVEEDLAKAGAGSDAELAAAAQKLIAAVQQYAPGAAAAIGVDLKDVAAANLRLSDIEASWTAVNVEHSTFSGDIEIHGVRAGVRSTDSPKEG
jgi:hypothetical protein